MRELVDDYVYRHHHKMYPVLDGDTLVGCVTTRDVRELPQGEWERQSVGTLASEPGDDNTVAPDMDAMEALSKMSRTRTSRLMVVDDRGALVGILSLTDLLDFFSMKMELERDGGDGDRLSIPKVG